MNVNIDQSWKTYLNPEFEKPYFKELMTFVESEYKNFQCFPKRSEIFNAFNHCAFNDVKVVIIGQDPYHDIGQANGLCFSVNDGIAFPPSLRNIFKELNQVAGKEIPQSGDLSSWAKQGVLLLNATLTVRASQAGSHQRKGWEDFTDAVIHKINEEKELVVFILWGNYAIRKGEFIDRNKHLVLTSVHPSPLSASRGFFGNNHFGQANDFLEGKGKEAIDW